MEMQGNGKVILKETGKRKRITGCKSFAASIK